MVHFSLILGRQGHHRPCGLICRASCRPHNRVRGAAHGVDEVGVGLDVKINAASHSCNAPELKGCDLVHAKTRSHEPGGRARKRRIGGLGIRIAAATFLSVRNEDNAHTCFLCEDAFANLPQSARDWRLAGWHQFLDNARNRPVLDRAIGA